MTRSLRIGGGLLLAFSLVAVVPASGVEPTPLEGTEPLKLTGDIPAQMRAGIDRFVTRETERSVAERAKLWKRDFTSREAYEKSVAPNRERFRKVIGVVDPRLPVKELELVGGTMTPSKLGETDAYTVFAVRWPVLEGVYGEGLLLEPKAGAKANIVALPDADQTPEMIAGLADGVTLESQFARRLAESGCRVVVPTLIDRTDEWSGTPDIWMTNKPHREWVYCAGFDLGRHVIGYEVQKVLALVDWMKSAAKDTPVGVAGYGEGGLIAMYAAAADTRIDAALVSGYFDSRQKLDDEPLYRNVFGLLAEFGDAEIASLIAPRPLVLEHSNAPKVDGPPAAREGRRAWAAPGAIRTPVLANVYAEIARLKAFFPADAEVKPKVQHILGDTNDSTTTPGSADALRAFLGGMGAEFRKSDAAAAAVAKSAPDPRERQHRQVTQLIDHTQMLLGRSERTRAEFWKDAKPDSIETWQASTKKYRDYFWDKVIGRFPKASAPMNPRTRKVIDDPKFTAYEVTLDVWPDVFCFGMLLVPKDIKPGEHRPVVVCQHGLEGEPNDVVTRDTNTQGWKYYHAFATRLAERGFVTYAPHNFYRGGNEFRQLQRKLYPLKKTMYSIILANSTSRHLEWLASQPFVDAKRIGFYGLSYGGFTAIRVPPLLDGYCLSINSGEFNDMARKKASTRDVYSYPFYPGYEIFEWNLANTFNYGDLAGFMVPRPFMVERGHDDGVGTDEWVASEFAKVRRRYDKLGIGDKTEIEFFNGVHEIHAVGAFKFLHKHLNWPEPTQP